MKNILTIILILLSFLNSYSQMKPKSSLKQIAFYFVDLKKSAAFYQDIIGLDTIPEPFHDGKHTWFSIGPKSHLHLIEGAKEITEHPKSNHLCFTVNSVEDFARNLQKQGVEYGNWPGEKFAITTRPDGVKQIYLKDPDGYWIEINDARE